MPDQMPKKRSAWQEANGNGWLGIALFVFCITVGALVFGTNDPKVADGLTPGQTSQQ